MLTPNDEISMIRFVAVSVDNLYIKNRDVLFQSERLYLLVMNDVLLTVRDLSVDFQSDGEIVHALQHISFDLAKGKTLAVVGESGSGKSVLALSIMRLLPSPQGVIRKGTIHFAANNTQHVDIVSCSADQLESLRGQQIGMIFQEPMTSLNPLMTCGRQVAETIVLHTKVSYKQALDETRRLFEEVQLPDPISILNRYPHELSGGQKQRVMIAIAICCNPSLLIADEPTTALDVTVQKTILDLLSVLQEKRGMAILFITHDLNLVRHFADAVLIMYRSRVVEYGETNTIYTNPVDPYTKGLLHCRPPMHQRIKLLKSVEESINETDDTFDVTNTISSESFHQRIASLEKQSPILELKNLHCWYPVKRNIVGNANAWFKAVDGVSLSMKEGETLGLVGESGCGKTTIGKSIVLLTAITKGEILYRGKNVQDFSIAELAAYRKNVQMIFQDPYSSLNPRISIGEAIREPMDVHGIHASAHRKQQVIELLEKVGLSADHYQRYPHEFSGGQRQRICIARALALEPQCIICDESVSALDVSVQAQVLNLLVSLRDEYNLSYLFISHDLRVVKHISDHVAVMQKGRIEEVGNAEQMYTSPISHYTRTLIASSL